MDKPRKILLNYGERNKIAELSYSQGSGDKVAIVQHARTLFSLEEHEIYPQEYVEEFEEWIDIDDDFVAQNKEKKRIVSVAPVSMHACIVTSLLISLISQKYAMLFIDFGSTVALLQLSGGFTYPP